MHVFEWHIVALTLGMLLSFALLGGLLAQMVHLPRVTAYLLVGLALGPYVLGAIHEEEVHYLDPLAKLAMALVLFNMGCHFTLAHFRRILPRVIRLSFGELGLTLLVVTLGLLLLGASWKLAVLFGALALATAPATTILVLRENQSEGLLTEYTTALVALNNLASVLLFEVLFILIHFMNGGLKLPIHMELGMMGRDLLGSVALGIAAGIMTSFGCGLLSQRAWLVLLVGMTSLVLGACKALEIPYLLTFLAMGATVANAADRPRDVTRELDRITTLLCVIFFVIHGAEFDLSEVVKAGESGLALIAIGYIVLRCFGKYFGIYLTARSQGEDPAMRRWLGAGMLSQAGAAIALSAIAADPVTGLGEMGEQVQTVILGTVIFFEIVGPILLRMALIRSGEVPLGQVIHHTSSTPWDELRGMLNRVMVACGYEPWRGRSSETLVVGDLARRNVKAINASATFDEVVEVLEHSHDNTFPVVGVEGNLLGVIRYSHLRDALFDTELGSLVCAADLAVPCAGTLQAEDDLTRAWEAFRRQNVDSIPVVSGKEPHQLVGMIKRRDLLQIYSRQRPRGGSNMGGQNNHTDSS